MQRPVIEDQGIQFGEGDEGINPHLLSRRRARTLRLDGTITQAIIRAKVGFGDPRPGGAMIAYVAPAPAGSIFQLPRRYPLLALGAIRPTPPATSAPTVARSPSSVYI